jgi:glutamate-ammonia-ligase adenylyltransferase
MEFVQKITRLPRAYDPDRGAEGGRLFGQLSGDLAALVRGAAGCSPYLLSLMTREADWMARAFEAPETALSQEFARLHRVAPGDLGSALRQAKKRVALLTALADLAGVWTLEEVTRALTEFADLAVQLSLRATVGAEIRRGKLPGMGEADLETLGGMFVLCMGKMGAHELNYSSDIDLICLFDETRFERTEFFEARKSFIKATRAMSAMLNDRTAEGYVFRTDLRLRPDPAVTPVCMAAEAAERYYESLGRTWERAAYIKARCGVGDVGAGEAFLETLRPFVWRKHLDFAAIEDAHNMRLRIRAHKGLGGKIDLLGHNMKLGRGGIREIEFFTQTRQLISGGRDPELRLRATVPSLGVLAQKGWVPEEVAGVLSAHYRAHREVEHRVQMIGDQQTHLLPNSADGMEQLAAFMGRERAELERDLRARLEEVHALTEGFFAPDAIAPEPDLPELDGQVISRWPSYAALRSERGTQIFGRLKPDILRALAKSSDPHAALLAFDGFLAGLPAGVQLFSLFEANPQLVDLVVDIVSTAPALAGYLSRNAGVFDAVIGGGFFADWPGVAALASELSAQLAAEEDYERKLDLARRWRKEWHFRVGVHFLRGLTGAEEASTQYAALAEAALKALWPAVVAQFSCKYGPPPGKGAAVIGMGSLGAGRLTSSSDLDIIVIYEADGAEMSQGRRPLATRPYYARLTQALVTAVNAPMAEGRLYELDMRLRPSGNQGPVATSWPAFQAYQQDEAWLWEHLALVRARPVCGLESLGAKFRAFREALLVEKGQDLARTRQGVAAMRAKIAAAKAPNGVWDAKIGPGRLQDIELFSQMGALSAGSASLRVQAGLKGLLSAGIVDKAAVDSLMHAYRQLWAVNLSTRFLSDKPFEAERASEGASQLLLRETGAKSLVSLATELQGLAQTAAAVIDKALQGAGNEG